MPRRACWFRKLPLRPNDGNHSQGSKFSDKQRHASLMPEKRDCQTPPNAQYVTKERRRRAGTAGQPLVGPPARRVPGRLAAASRGPKSPRCNGLACARAARRFLGLNWNACPKASSPPAPPRKPARCGRTTREPGSGDAVRDERARLPPLTCARTGHRRGARAPHRGGACPARAPWTTSRLRFAQRRRESSPHCRCDPALPRRRCAPATGALPT